MFFRFFTSLADTEGFFFLNNYVIKWWTVCIKVITSSYDSSIYLNHHNKQPLSWISGVLIDSKTPSTWLACSMWVMSLRMRDKSWRSGLRQRRILLGKCVNKLEPLGSRGNALTAGKVPRSINHLPAAAAVVTVALFGNESSPPRCRGNQSCCRPGSHPSAEVRGQRGTQRTFSIKKKKNKPWICLKLPPPYLKKCL